tara:strand:- start:180 stop:827 length:648 start_codon:yes stop_codon:yes gene_type:complete
MTSSNVTIIDYGIGNLLSVKRGLEKCGAKAIISSSPEETSSSDRIILPGVGAFSKAMEELRNRGLIEAIKDSAKRGVPLLGICLGMQMLLDESEEFGISEGLGLIPGRVIPIHEKSKNNSPLTIPHIGWNALVGESLNNWEKTLLKGLKQGDDVYFVHSFMAKTYDKSHSLAYCNYGDYPITAVVANKNIMGCQFHPEKSGDVGLKILRNFLSIG